MCFSPIFQRRKFRTSLDTVQLFMPSQYPLNCVLTERIDSRAYGTGTHNYIHNYLVYRTPVVIYLLTAEVLGVGGKYWDKQGWRRPVHITLTGVSKNQKSKITTNSSNSTTPCVSQYFPPHPSTYPLSLCQEFPQSRIPTFIFR